MEATIPDVHRAIQEGQITCRGLVQAYVNRANAYNGVCNQLVTEENATTFLPNYAEYKAAVMATLDRRDSDPAKTPPIEFGRMEPTASLALIPIFAAVSPTEQRSRKRSSRTRR